MKLIDTIQTKRADFLFFIDIKPGFAFREYKSDYNNVFIKVDCEYHQEYYGLAMCILAESEREGFLYRFDSGSKVILVEEQLVISN